MLSLMVDYLPLGDKLIDCLDFVDSFSSFGDLNTKALKFNKKFKIIQETEMPQLKLSARKRYLYADGSKNILQYIFGTELITSNSYYYPKDYRNPIFILD